MNSIQPVSPSKAEIDEESRRVRRLRIVVNLSLSIIAQGNLPYEEAQEIAACSNSYRYRRQAARDESTTIVIAAPMAAQYSRLRIYCVKENCVPFAEVFTRSLGQNSGTRAA